MHTRTPRACTPHFQFCIHYEKKETKKLCIRELERRLETKSFPARKVGLNPRTGVFSPPWGESRKANLGSRKFDPSVLSDRRTLLLPVYTNVACDTN